MMATSYDEENGTVTVDGEEILLTPRENEAYGLLWQARPGWVHRDELARALDVDTESPKAYMKHMRDKGVPIESRFGYGWRAK